MLNKRDKVIVYALVPVLFLVFIIGKIWKLCLEFWDDIQDGIEESDYIL